jgi:hypothetical protein
MPERDALIRRAQLMLVRAYVAPRTPVEERLARIWRDVLGMDAVGVEDSYYDLGGDSLRPPQPARGCRSDPMPRARARIRCLWPERLGIRRGRLSRWLVVHRRARGYR